MHKLSLQCVETIKAVDRELRITEDDIMTNVSDEVRQSAQMLDGERLNFGLVQVVYEWARSKVNKIIFKLYIILLHITYNREYRNEFACFYYSHSLKLWSLQIFKKV